MIETIININSFLKKNSWCDFEIIELKGILKIGGKTSFENKYDIIISFEDVFFLQCLQSWRTDTSQESFTIPTIEEQRNVNLKYSIEQGFQLFKIIAEDLESPIYVSSKKIAVDFPD